ncbi:AraC family transcriptional regulator [Aeoliella mucimassa]|uniref:Xylose operon regulatory protein n=1 Tax=Aeoliella mucimassa TaxID=2527972 RepID=A0A518AR65_9BACT|nr:XylR family transcriptional regulator [Aeoliella mucimassa]QDU57210.1 Xylose operon regulatory protein [Aeoliella mucimassa]
MSESEHPPEPSPGRLVAVLVDIDDMWGRRIVQAVSEYSHAKNWQLLIAPRDTQGRLRIPPQWQPDGAIVSMRDKSMVAHVKSAEVPTINVSGMYLDEGWAGHVATDDEVRATMAVDHLRSRRIQHFASYAPAIGRYNIEREQAFVSEVRKAGFQCSCYTNTKWYRQSTWLDDRQNVGEWIDSLPKPVGVFAADPYPARQLVEICAWRGYEIPEEVAILSGDEDDLLCESASPPITSIELASHRIGHEASRMLDQRLADRDVQQPVQRVKPLRVCMRRSTESRHISDPAVASCVRVIWESPPDRVEVRDLVKVARVSRRTLEQKFRDKLGRTPAEEIRRMRLEKARQLIVSTSLSIATIAETCGLSSGPYLSRIFRKYYGITPSELRSGRSVNV